MAQSTINELKAKVNSLEREVDYEKGQKEQAQESLKEAEFTLKRMEGSSDDKVEALLRELSWFRETFRLMLLPKKGVEDERKDPESWRGGTNSPYIEFNGPTPYDVTTAGSTLSEGSIQNAMQSMGSRTDEASPMTATEMEVRRGPRGLGQIR